ncbi:MAG: hemolysin family protein [Puia sp.]|nr:hemolysin family protein [Puia sp.]
MLFLIILILLILVNSYFSAAEIAIVSVKKFKMQEEADKGNKSAKQILEYLKDPDEYLSSIQVGITLVGMIEGLYGGEVLEAWLEPRFVGWGLPSLTAHILGIVIGIGFITYLSIVIGELLPKTMALRQPQKIALRIAPSFRIFTILAYPFVKLLTMSTHLMTRLLGVRNPENIKVSELDLKNLLSLAYRQGTLEKNKYLLHENIFTFYERTVGTIMTPHDKAVVIEDTMTPEVVEGLLRQSHHNYFPVVRDKRHVVGYLSAKDFFMTPVKTIQEIVKPACTLTGDKKASDLLQKFKEKHQNFGIVVNEKGELAGVVTMHDVAEEIVGQFA